MRLRPISIAPHSSSHVCLERVEGALRLDCPDRDDCVHVVCTHVEGMQEPLSVHTYFADGEIDTLTLPGIEYQGFRPELAAVKITPAITPRQIRSLVAIVEAID
jgi:hypothetical protein